MRNRHSITLDPHELKVMKALSAELRCGDAAGTRLLERIVGQKSPDASDRILKPQPAHNRTAVGQFVESGSLIRSPRKPGISSIPIELTSHKGSGGTATAKPIGRDAALPVVRSVGNRVQSSISRRTLYLTAGSVLLDFIEQLGDAFADDK